MTEDEARQKWCPMVRHYSGSHNVKANERVPEHCRCIASDCMMWRKSEQIGIGPRGEKRDRDLDGRTRWVDTGYCGLAGKPND